MVKTGFYELTYTMFNGGERKALFESKEEVIQTLSAIYELMDSRDTVEVVVGLWVTCLTGTETRKLVTIFQGNESQLRKVVL